MLTFDGVWHVGEVFSSRMNPGCHCSGQMADSVWVSSLLMSTLWSGPWWRWGYSTGRCMYGQRTQVLFIEGIVNAQRYCDEILRPTVVPFAHHLMLLHDNERPHVARICTQSLEAENISVLAGPAYSQDTSPTGYDTYTTACSSSCQYPAAWHSH